MNETLIFSIVFVIHLVIIWYFNKNYHLLRDDEIPSKKAQYKYLKVQLAWWTLIILSSFITIIFTKCKIPTLHTSTLILLGISAATTAAARAIDVSKKTDQPPASQSAPASPPAPVNSRGILIDILSDNNSINMHRLQSVIINVVFGVYFINAVLCNLKGSGCVYIDEITLEVCRQNPINYIMPVISTNNLVLLGLSSATYVALKSTENK